MMEGLKYIQAGEVMIPDLTTIETKPEIGKYGSMREKFLKQHRQGSYSAMVLQGTLGSYLQGVNEETKELIEKIASDLLTKDPGPDKASDQMGWVRHQNMVRSQAEEIAIAQMIYA